MEKEKVVNRTPGLPLRTLSNTLTHLTSSVALVKSTACSSIRMLFIMLKSYPWEFSPAWFGNARGYRGNSKCSLILQPTRAPRAATVQQNQTGPSVYSAAKHSLAQSGSNNYSFDLTSVEVVQHAAAGRSRKRWRCAACHQLTAAAPSQRRYLSCRSSQSSQSVPVTASQ